MGEVYLARDTSELDRTLAIKLLPAEVAANPKRMQRFVQEARTVSALNHPNVLTIFEFGHDGDTRFIAMEYVEGVTLREHLRGHRLKLHEVWTSRRRWWRPWMLRMKRTSFIVTSSPTTSWCGAATTS
jgi:serine/threonine protein kinase